MSTSPRTCFFTGKHAHADVGMAHDTLYTYRYARLTQLPSTSKPMYSLPTRLSRGRVAPFRGNS